MDSWIFTITAIVCFLIFCGFIDRIFRYGSGSKETKTLLNPNTLQDEGDMAKITDANLMTLKLEGGKKQVNVAQGLDYISKLNKVLGGDLYKLIRSKNRHELADATRAALK